MSGLRIKTKQTLLSFGFYLFYDVLFSKLKPSLSSLQGLFMQCNRFVRAPLRSDQQMEGELRWRVDH